jgi:energy-converting hydrogenase Eha subunit B
MADGDEKRLGFDGDPRSVRALCPRGNQPAPIVFHHGAHRPYAIRWFGVTSLFGHLRHFAASAIAAESVDSRDWMQPQTPAELLQAVKRVLGIGAQGPSDEPLASALGRPLWIDFVADTGDDRDVSVAVGRMIFAEYEVERARRLPRGEILLFGGDTAYPVATAEEIYGRVIGPWNEVLAEFPDDGKPRALLGIPGNHDWYDGLDGFARLFRAAPTSGTATSSTTATITTPSSPPATRSAGLVARQLHLDEVGGLFGLLVQAGRSVRAFFKGTTIKRRTRLTLAGYQAVQEASYFSLPIATGLHLWGVDRQLRRIDFRQRAFFQGCGETAKAERILFVAPDPALAFGESHDPGMRMLTACHLSLKNNRIFYLTGDVHHYERRDVGASIHVIAGGGGAFLHGTRVAPGPGGEPTAVFPDRATSRRLVAQVPLKLMAGKAGLLAHLALMLFASIELEAGEGHVGWIGAALLTIAVIVVLYFVAGHHRAHPRRVLAVAIPFGAVLGLSPLLLKTVVSRFLPVLTGDTALMLVYVFGGAFVIGLFLMTLVITGIEHQQAFSILGHPGFKHFVRLCVHPDGRVEAWAIGKDDPLDATDPVIIDQFEW